MDIERREKLLKAHSIGMKRYILIHGVVNWGITTAIIYRILIVGTTYGWSLEGIVKGILSIETIFSIIFFGLVGIIFGFFMWKWIDREVKKLPPLPTKSKGNGKKKKK